MIFLSCKEMIGGSLKNLAKLWLVLYKIPLVHSSFLCSYVDTEGWVCPEMHALAKMAEMAINRQNRQTIHKNSN